MASTISSGAQARARSCANLQKRMVSCSLSNNGWRWFAVIPEGPAAAPLRAFRMFFAQISWSRENHGPRRSKRSSRRGSRGSDGRLDSSTTHVVWSRCQERGKHIRGQRVLRRVHPSGPEPRHDLHVCAHHPPAVDGDGGVTPRKLGWQNPDFPPTDRTVDLRQNQRTAGEACTWECCRLAEDGDATNEAR